MLLSYKNDEKLKEMFLEEVIRHRKEGMIVQGTYGEKNGKWRGCAVGCSIHSLNILLKKKYSTENHAVYKKELGMPEWLAELEDSIFSGMPEKSAKLFPERFAKAVPVGVNLEPVKWHFCASILKENIERVLLLSDTPYVKIQAIDAIRQALAVHENAIKTGKWDAKAAKKARWTAWAGGRPARAAAWATGGLVAAAMSELIRISIRIFDDRQAAHEKYAKELLKLLRRAK